MNPQAVLVKGTLKPDGTLELDEKPSLPPGRVEVTLRGLDEKGKSAPGLVEVLEQMRKAQEARGYKGRTIEEMEADEAAQRAENEEYEEHWRQIWAQTTSPPPHDS